MGKESHHPPLGWSSDSETPVDRQGPEGQPLQVEKLRLGERELGFLDGKLSDT